jgi:hypothetical protein
MVQRGRFLMGFDTDVRPGIHDHGAGCDEPADVGELPRLVELAGPQDLPLHDVRACEGQIHPHERTRLDEGQDAVRPEGEKMHGLHQRVDPRGELSHLVRLGRRRLGRDSGTRHPWPPWGWFASRASCA